MVGNVPNPARFSSEIYFGIHQFGNEFFLNRMSFKRKQAHHRMEEWKRKKVISICHVNSQRIGIMLKLEAIKIKIKLF